MGVITRPLWPDLTRWQRFRLTMLLFPNAVHHSHPEGDGPCNVGCLSGRDRRVRLYLSRNARRVRERAAKG